MAKNLEDIITNIVVNEMVESENKIYTQNGIFIFAV